MNKEVTKENISQESVRALDFAKVMAIAFAEVGAQGMPNYIEVISDLTALRLERLDETMSAPEAAMPDDMTAEPGIDIPF